MEQKNSKKNDVNDTFAKDVEMLKYFQDEFQYRHKHYWDILIKLFILTVVVTILPIASSVFGLELNQIPKKLIVAFPFLGGIISVLSKIILFDEAKKMSAVNKAKYRINSQLMDAKYHYEFYNKDIIQNSDSEKDKKENGKRKWLSFKMLWILAILEWIIIIYVLIVILTLPQIVTV